MAPELTEMPGTLLYVGAYAAGNILRADYLSNLAKAGNEITVLEVWEPALDELLNSRVAKHIARAQVGSIVDPPRLPRDTYDYIVWWHGPEHVKQAQVDRALASVDRLTRGLSVIASPWGQCRGEPEFGNPHNEHKQYLYYEDYDRWGYEVAALGPKDQCGGCMIGVRRKGGA